MWLFIVIIVTMIFVSVELYFRLGRKGRDIRKIPGPKSFPIIGNLWSYVLSPEKLFLHLRSLQNEYGDVNQVHMMNIRMVNISNPTDIEKLLSGPQGSHKDHPYTYIACWLGEGLLLSNGQKWSQRRKMLTKAFHFNILKKFFVTFAEQADDFIKCVQEEVEKKRTDLSHMIINMTLSIMCASDTDDDVPFQDYSQPLFTDNHNEIPNSITGTSRGNDESAMGLRKEDTESLRHQYRTSMEVVGDCVTKRFRRGWLHSEHIYQLTSLARKQKIAVNNLHFLTNSVINKRRVDLTEKKIDNLEHDNDYKSNKKLPMLDLLLENEKLGVIDHQDIRDEVSTFMFAGHDTSAIAMTFMLMALANEPEIQDKVFSEICEVLNYSDRSPTQEDLNQMKYLECCIKESMRLYPSAPMIARHLQKEIVLGGYTIPADSTITIFIYDLHRRPDLFPEPERFIPERFLPENCANRHPYAYIPFSAGYRNCIGQKFAMLEMKTIMSKLLRRFRVEPVTKPEDIVYRTDIMLRTAQPIYVKFCERQ